MPRRSPAVARLGPGSVPLILAAVLAIGCIAALAACGTAPPRPAVDGVPLVPVGWNSWNAFGCGVDQAEVEAAADAMVSSGMRAAGYRYVVVDDCWVARARDAGGRLHADRSRFPSGMAALARYVHARGLRFGLYTSATTRTCAQRTGAWPGSTGSEGHESVDAATFAAWGVDLVKDDWCAGGIGADRQRARFQAFRDGIRAAGRPMVLSINPNSGVSGVPGAEEDWAGVATTVRISHDVVPAWRRGGSASSSRGVSEGIAAAEASVRARWSQVVRQDADMLVVGHPQLTLAEQRSQIAMLAELGLPLMAGNELPGMSVSTRSLLGNRRIVELARDPTGRPMEVGAIRGVHVWERRTTSGRVMAAYNPTGHALTISLEPHLGPHARDLLSGARVATNEVTVLSHDTVLPGR